MLDLGTPDSGCDQIRHFLQQAHEFYQLVPQRFFQRQDFFHRKSDQRMDRPDDAGELQESVGLAAVQKSGRHFVSVAAEGLVALGLSGELDIETVPIFEAALEQALADPPATVVLVMHRLEFLDSTGLRAILEADERLRGQGARLVLTHARRNVQLTFAITGLDAHLSFIDTLAQLTGDEQGK